MRAQLKYTFLFSVCGIYMFKFAHVQRPLPRLRRCLALLPESPTIRRRGAYTHILCEDDTNGKQ